MNVNRNFRAAFLKRIATKSGRRCNRRPRFPDIPQLLQGGSLIKSYQDLFGFDMSAVAGQVTPVCPGRAISPSFAWDLNTLNTTNRTHITICVYLARYINFPSSFCLDNFISFESYWKSRLLLLTERGI